MVASENVRAELERVLAHSLFSGAERRAQLLRFLVEETLRGRTSSLKESVLAVEVFGRIGQYDPKLDSVVRVEMGRLRSKLLEYYAADGCHDPIRIEVPKGRYLPVFTLAEPETKSEEIATVEALPPSRTIAKYILVTAAICVVIAGFLLWRRLPPDRAAQTPSLAILPFLNLSGDANQAYLADSITDEITEELAESQGLRVVARTSAFQFKGRGQDIREIGRRLNVSDVLEGSLERERNQLDLVVQLIRASDGYHVWSHRFEGTDASLRVMEAQIADSTNRALLPESQRTAPAEFRTTADPQAHDLYLRAAYLFHQGNAGELKQAIELARQAAERDPSFARADVLIAKAELNLVSVGAISARQGWELSLERMEKVAVLDPGSSEVHTYFAHRSYVNDWNWPKAEHEFQVALSSPGSHAGAHNLYGWALMTRGRFQEARGHFNAALEIDPMVVSGARQNLAVDWILERKASQARQALAGMLQMNPNYLAAKNLLQWVDASQHDCSSMKADAPPLAPLMQIWRVWEQAMVDTVCSQRPQARQQLVELAKQPPTPGISPYVLAEAYGFAGDADRALPLLEQAADQRDSTIFYLELDPLFDPVRSNARFQALARRIGLTAD